MNVTEPDELTVDINVLTDYFGFAVSCDYSEDGAIEAVSSGGTGATSFSWDTNPVQTTAMIENLGIGVYTITVLDINNCIASTDVLLEGNPSPVFEVVEPLELCENELAEIETFSTNASSCVWEFSDGQIFQECGYFEVDFGIVGCVDATVTVTSPEGCVTQQFYPSHVCYEPNPIAAFSQSATNITTVPSNVYFWNESIDATYYMWDFDDGATSTEVNPNHFFPDIESGEYEVLLLAYTDFGCVDSAMITIFVKEEFLMYVPNTFTPDGDQFNNTFQPVLTSGFNPQDYTLLIFNRWGEVLFESRDPEVGWNGTYGGKMSKDGTYVWRIVVGNKEGAGRREFTGHVNLLR